MRDRYIFPAVFNYAEDGISISFPDLPGCFSCADTDEEAIQMAEEAMGLHLYGMEQYDEPIPEPTRGADIRLEPNERIFLVDTWMPRVREEVKPVYVKKTLTIPSDLNKGAMEADLNFSQILASSLRSILKRRKPRSRVSS